MLYWEPGVEDIRTRPTFFSLALADNDRLTARWPQAGGQGGQQRHHRGAVRQRPEHRHQRKSVVVDWYYKREKPGGQTVVHYCKFCNGVVLYASENDPAMAETGFYDHGKYPFCVRPALRGREQPGGLRVHRRDEGHPGHHRPDDPGHGREHAGSGQETLPYLGHGGRERGRAAGHGEGRGTYHGTAGRAGLYGAGDGSAALQHHRIPAEPRGRAEGGQRQPGREPGRRDQRPDGGLGHRSLAGSRLEAQPGYAERALTAPLQKNATSSST